MKVTLKQETKSSQRLSLLVRRILVKPMAFLNKNPIMFKAKSFHLVYFGLFTSLGAMTSLSLFYFYLYVRGSIAGLPVIPVALAFVLGHMIGAKFIYYFALGKTFFRNIKSYLNETTVYNQGGLLGIFLVGITVLLVYKIKPMIIFDGMAFGGSMGLFWGRLGCLNYGCCFGKPTDSPAHVTYHTNTSKIIRTNPELRGVPIVPTQLYTAYFDLMIFIVFVIVANIYPADGLIALIFILIFNIFRISIQRHRFTEKSDRINFTKMAFIYMVSGLLIWMVIFLVSGASLEPRASQISLTPIAWIKFVINTPGVFISMAIVGIISFLFYGVHGRELGTHINLF